MNTISPINTIKISTKQSYFKNFNNKQTLLENSSKDEITFKSKQVKILKRNKINSSIKDKIIEAIKIPNKKIKPGIIKWKKPSEILRTESKMLLDFYTSPTKNAHTITKDGEIQTIWHLLDKENDNKIYTFSKKNYYDSSNNLYKTHIELKNSEEPNFITNVTELYSNNYRTEVIVKNPNNHTFNFKLNKNGDVIEEIETIKTPSLNGYSVINKNQYITYQCNLITGVAKKIIAQKNGSEYKITAPQLTFNPLDYTFNLKQNNIFKNLTEISKYDNKNGIGADYTINSAYAIAYLSKDFPELAYNLKSIVKYLKPENKTLNLLIQELSFNPNRVEFLHNNNKLDYLKILVDLEHTNPKLNEKFNTIIDSNKNNYRKNIDFEQLWNESKLSVE